MKVHIVGTSGAGKTVFGNKLSNRLGINCYNIDDYYWNKDWTPNSDEVFHRNIDDLVAQDDWILDGNYFFTPGITEKIWSRADKVIYMDVPLSLSVYSVFKRSLFNALSGKKVCNGNDESLIRLFSKDSIILWALKTHNQTKSEFNRFFHSVLKGDSSKVIQFASRKEAQQFLGRRQKKIQRILGQSQFRPT